MWSLSPRSGPAEAPLAIVLLLALSLGGCASTSSSGEKAEAPSVWDRTVRSVSSALETTKTAVTSTVRRIVREQREGWEEMLEKEKKEQESAAKPAAPIVRAPRPAPADRFPAGRVVSREQNLGRQEPPRPRGAEGREIVLLPRIPQTPDQIRARMAEIDRVLPGERDPAQRRRLAAERARLAGALQASAEEESLIREMEELRARLRRLQNRLNEIQRARP
ncbi:MAG: hypothetical protein A3I72_06260 [Candidatus Tectomicrobia bacterium RIFCSPLOWO2_02_FULL_70_19]|nr:MAG: hypothetical protein A3I72_06260 [Candidatus Tectomicrobia bacterium RIFCSPLOWO2_02_FULL_70_19]